MIYTSGSCPLSASIAHIFQCYHFAISTPKAAPERLMHISRRLEPRPAEKSYIPSSISAAMRHTPSGLQIVRFLEYIFQFDAQRRKAPFKPAANDRAEIVILLRRMMKTTCPKPACIASCTKLVDDELAVWPHRFQLLDPFSVPRADPSSQYD